MTKLFSFFCMLSIHESWHFLILGQTFPNLDASLAFNFVFKAEENQRVSDLQSLQQKTMVSLPEFGIFAVQPLELFTLRIFFLLLISNAMKGTFLVWCEHHALYCMLYIVIVHHISNHFSLFEHGYTKPLFLQNRCHVLEGHRRVLFTNMHFSFCAGNKLASWKSYWCFRRNQVI